MKIIYVNGFMGGGPSAKIDALQKEFGEENVLNPYIPARMEDALNVIADVINRIPCHEDVIFVGTSLGGFIAAYAAYLYGCKSVLLNPCLNPNISLLKHVGKIVDDKLFTKEDCVNYEYYKTRVERLDYPCIVLCEEGDDVIPYTDVIRNINDNFKFKPEIRVFADGNHRFTNYPEMIKAINNIDNTETL